MGDRISQLLRVLDQLPDEQGEVLLKRMFMEDPLSALKVIQRHFGFEDLIYADEGGIDHLIDAMGSDQLVVALKGAPDRLLRRFTDRMGTGLVRTFIEDVDRSTARPDAVEQMRRAVLMKALILHRKGRLRMQRPGIDG